MKLLQGVLISLTFASQLLAVKCVDVEGTIVSHFVAPTCGGIMCTEGKIKSNSQLLNGTTKYAVRQVGGFAGDPEGKVILSYVGDLEIKTKMGTLVIQNDLGTFDQGNKIVSSQAVQMKGTGKYEKVSGLFYTWGVGTEVGFRVAKEVTGFDAGISGHLCFHGKK